MRLMMSRRWAVVLAAVAACSGADAFAQTVSAVTGTLTEGNSITIAGSAFGSTGPTVVLFDNFEGGTSGTPVAGNAATVGTWAPELDPSPPRYDTSFHVSGSKSMMSDFQIAGNSSAWVAFPSQTSEMLLSYWVYMPTTSGFPNNPSGPNWKVSWLWHDGNEGTDLILPLSMQPSEPFSGWDLACNSCYQGGGDQNTWFSPDWNMYKGHWYRLMFYVRATNDASGHEDGWVLSPASDGNVQLTQTINRNVQMYQNAPVGGGYWGYLLLGAYGRVSSFESRPRFDDAYLASGPGARARVEIGDAPTYAGCTNLAIQPVTGWGGTSITATVRSGSFTSLSGRYLYVIDSTGRASSGFRLGGATSSVPSAPTNVRIVKGAAINLLGGILALSMVVRRRMRA